MYYWCDGCGQWHDREPIKMRTVQDANGRRHITETYCDEWRGNGMEQYQKPQTTAE